MLGLELLPVGCVELIELTVDLGTFILVRSGHFLALVVLLRDYSIATMGGTLSPHGAAASWRRRPTTCSPTGSPSSVAAVKVRSVTNPHPALSQREREQLPGLLEASRVMSNWLGSDRRTVAD